MIRKKNLSDVIQLQHKNHISLKGRESALEMLMWFSTPQNKELYISDPTQGHHLKWPGHFNQVHIKPIIHNNLSSLSSLICLYT